jgi:hypothetical protein
MGAPYIYDISHLRVKEIKIRQAGHANRMDEIKIQFTLET